MRVITSQVLAHIFQKISGNITFLKNSQHYIPDYGVLPDGSVLDAVLFLTYTTRICISYLKLFCLLV